MKTASEKQTYYYIKLGPFPDADTAAQKAMRLLDVDDWLVTPSDDPYEIEAQCSICRGRHPWHKPGTREPWHVCE